MGAFLRSLLDPDTNWRSWSTLQHYASGVILCAIMDAVLGFSPGHALELNAWTAVIYEAGQTDASYNIKDGSGRRWAGRPGFGFGLMDIAAHMLGSLSWLAARLVLGV